MDDYPFHAVMSSCHVATLVTGAYCTKFVADDRKENFSFAKDPESVALQISRERKRQELDQLFNLPRPASRSIKMPETKR
jgi:hypothetical protein